MSRFARALLVPAVLCGAVLAAHPLSQRPAAAAPAVPDRSQVQFRVTEPVLMNWLQAVTPYTVTVGSGVIRTDLVLAEPRDLVLRGGKATLKIRVQGRQFPIQQVVAPVVTVRYDARAARYFLVVSSMPVQVPGLGTLDLKDYFPALEIPERLDNLWQSPDRPIGLNLKIRRIEILDHAVEIGADATFSPAPQAALDGAAAGSAVR